MSQPNNPTNNPNSGRLEYAANVEQSIRIDVPGVDIPAKGDSMVASRIASLSHMPKPSATPAPVGEFERNLYSPEQKKLAELSDRAVTSKDAAEMQAIGAQLRSLLSLPIPQEAVFSRFVKDQNGALTINYYTEKNPRSTDVLERGHDSRSITISM